MRVRVPTSEAFGLLASLQSRYYIADMHAGRYSTVIVYYLHGTPSVSIIPIQSRRQVESTYLPEYVKNG